VRTLLEFFRLKNFEGPGFTLSLGEPYIMGGVIATICARLDVTACLFNRYMVTTLIGACTVVILNISKMTDLA
jgi:hypothetical protein